MIRIEKIKDGDRYHLPLDSDTEIFFEDFSYCFFSAKWRNLIVYRAIRDREMYYQENTPTGFGNPDYERLDGYLSGLLTGYGLCMSEDNSTITITKNSRIIMIVDKLPKPDSYYKKT